MLGQSMGDHNYACTHSYSTSRGLLQELSFIEWLPPRGEEPRLGLKLLPGEQLAHLSLRRIIADLTSQPPSNAATAGAPPTGGRATLKAP